MVSKVSCNVKRTCVFQPLLVLNTVYPTKLFFYHRTVTYKPKPTEQHLLRCVTIHSPESCMVANMKITEYVILNDTVNFSVTTSRLSPTSAVEILESRIRARVGLVSVFNRTCAQKSALCKGRQFCPSKADHIRVRPWPKATGNQGSL